jgi:hypothetical protein
MRLTRINCIHVYQLTYLSFDIPKSQTVKPCCLQAVINVVLLQSLI